MGPKEHRIEGSTYKLWLRYKFHCATLRKIHSANALVMLNAEC